MMYNTKELMTHALIYVLRVIVKNLLKDDSNNYSKYPWDHRKDLTYIINIA